MFRDLISMIISLPLYLQIKNLGHNIANMRKNPDHWKGEDRLFRDLRI